MARPFKKMHLLPIQDEAVQEALRKINLWAPEVDLLIAKNFAKKGGGSGVTVIQPTGTSAFDYNTLNNIPWTNQGSDVVRLTQQIRKIGIGTASPGGRIHLLNVGAVSEVLAILQAAAAQTGDTIRLLNSNSRNMAVFNKQGNLLLGNGTDVTVPAIIVVGYDSIGPTVGGAGANHAIITWGDNANALSTPQTTADMIGCLGARFYLYKDLSGTYDGAYGQSLADSWVMPGPEDITYSIFSGKHPSAPFLRAQWAGNGDYINYGAVTARKNVGAAVPTSPLYIGLEAPGGSSIIKLLAPNLPSGDRSQTFLAVTGAIPIVGDDPPAVASGALGKVSLITQGAAIAATNLTNGALVGMYQVNWYIETTMLDVTAGTIQFQIDYTDHVGATTQVEAVPLSLAALGRDKGSFQVYLASGNLSYQTNLGGIIGAAKYAITVRVMYLG